MATNSRNNEDHCDSIGRLETEIASLRVELGELITNSEATNKATVDEIRAMLSSFKTEMSQTIGQEVERRMSTAIAEGMRSRSGFRARGGSVSLPSQGFYAKLPTNPSILMEQNPDDQGLIEKMLPLHRSDIKDPCLLYVPLDETDDTEFAMPPAILVVQDTGILTAIDIASKNRPASIKWRCHIEIPDLNQSARIIMQAHPRIYSASIVSGSQSGIRRLFFSNVGLGSEYCGIYYVELSQIINELNNNPTPTDLGSLKSYRAELYTTGNFEGDSTLDFFGQASLCLRQSATVQHPTAVLFCCHGGQSALGGRDNTGISVYDVTDPTKRQKIGKIDKHSINSKLLGDFTPDMCAVYRDTNDQIFMAVGENDRRRVNLFGIFFETKEYVKLDTVIHFKVIADGPSIAPPTSLTFDSLGNIILAGVQINNKPYNKTQVFEWQPEPEASKGCHRCLVMGSAQQESQRKWPSVWSASTPEDAYGVLVIVEKNNTPSASSYQRSTHRPTILAGMNGIIYSFGSTNERNDANIESVGQ